METVHESQFQKVNLFAEHSFLEFIWQNTEELTDEEYCEELKLQVELISKYKVVKELFDTKDFVFTISIELQEWTAKNIFPELQKLGIKQFALVVPETLIAELSLSQAIDEDVEGAFRSKFFKSRDEARKFLASI